MRIPLSWLRDFVDPQLAVDDLAELITNAGLEVTAVDHLGVAGAPFEWDRELVRVAHVLEVQQHPEADRLVIATVDYGGPAPKQVITGAPNLFEFIGKGDISALALLSPIVLEGGTYLDHYKNAKPTKLKAKKLRGIMNDAMLCSPVELGLGEEHDGILLAPAADWRHTGEAPEAGTALADVLGDSVIEIDIIPNIARCASILGVAREVAALTERELTPPSFEVKAEGPSFEGALKITTEHPELNPRFVAILVEGVEQRPSPLWMQHRLQLCGQRSINAVVDVSNYVMLEMGQPNHAFDWDFLRERADAYAGPEEPVHLITRLGRSEESLTTLDDAEHKIPQDTILVTDPAGNLSVGGIMGGRNSEIQGNTTTVLLEAAAWNFINIRKSARVLGLNTEASFRFSRGVHPSQAKLGALRAAELLRLHASGTISQGVVDYQPLVTELASIELSTGYVNRRSGLELDARTIARCLQRLEFEVVVLDDDRLEVTAPDHRLDVEGPHDLLEEVCRMVGYANIPETVLADSLPPQRGNPAIEVEERIQDLLAAAGFQETISYRLTTPEAEANTRVGPQCAAGPYVTLSNPSTLDRAVMRQSLLASVLDAARSNLKNADHLSLFEIGHIYIEDGGSAFGENLPSERLRLALILSGPSRTGGWDRPVGEPYDFFDLKGIVERLLASLHVDGVVFETAEHPSFRPGRTASLRIGDQSGELGHLGELHPTVVEQLALRTENPVLAADLDLEVLIAATQTSFKIDPVPLYPAIREDLALLVDSGTPESTVQEALEAAGKPLLSQVELFDVYTDDKLGGKKSLAYHLTFRAANKTLKDKDVGKLRRRILSILEKQIGATLRS